MRPRLLRHEPGEELVFETLVVHRSLVRMQHAFRFVGDGTRCELVQSFEVDGLLVPVLWRWLHPGMQQFEALGRDLAARLADQSASAPSG